MSTGLIGTEVFVRYTAEGLHHWPTPPLHRTYLGYKHRHLFYVEVTVQVFEEDREIEFHDLLDFCRQTFSGGDLGGQSCEMMAHGLLDAVSARYGAQRYVAVSVSEDGEVGARVLYSPAPKDEDAPITGADLSAMIEAKLRSLLAFGGGA